MDFLFRAYHLQKNSSSDIFSKLKYCLIEMNILVVIMHTVKDYHCQFVSHPSVLKDFETQKLAS